MRFSVHGLACVGLALALAACGGGDGSPNPPLGGGPSNTAPTANAGAAQAVTSGVNVTLDGTASVDSDGSIASYSWTQTGGAPTVTLANATTAQPTFPAPQVLAATPLTFSLVVTDNRGTASAASTVIITVNPSTPGTINLTGQITFGRVPFSASAPFGLDYSASTQRPARGVEVRALDAATPTTVHGTAFTDASGNYSIAVPNNTNITLQVRARMVRSASPTWDVRVQDGSAGNNPYSFTDSAINSSSGTRNIAIPTGIDAGGTAIGARSSGPFAILDTIYQGMQTVLAADPAINFPALIVDWGSQTSGTFFSSGNPQRIALLANLDEDTDEFDQHVIAHEFGHYLEHNFSRADNIGGAHSLGNRLDARVAFGEGFGYAFAAIVLNDPNARDSFVNNGTQVSGGFDVERNPSTNPPVTPGDGLGCWCSESSVWSILYDLYDNNVDGSDNVALGFAPIWEVLTGSQRTTPAFTTVFSFITALKTANPGQSAAIDALVGAQNITTAGMDAFGTTETHEPVSGFTLTPVTATAVLGAPLTLQSTDNAGRYNKAGNHRFVRYTPASSGNFTVTLTTSNASFDRDPDFRVFDRGTFVSTNGGQNPPSVSDSATISGVAGRTYVIDIYDCANGCSAEEGVPGDYDLTVTIN